MSPSFTFRGPTTVTVAVADRQSRTAPLGIPSHGNLDWGGGETLTVNRDQMIGWEDMKPGDWFKATILRSPGGEVTQAIMQSKASPPRCLDAEQLDEFYSKIKPAELTLMD